MDIVKVFIEEPAGLEALVRDDNPDAHRRDVELGSLEALLAGSPFKSDYARAYLAGTHMGAPLRIGLTALADAEAFIQPLLAWAGDRPWTHLSRAGDRTGLLPAEAATHLRQPIGRRRQPDDTAALAIGPVDGLALATAASGPRRESVPALRTLLDANATVLLPEAAHDGFDWSLFTKRPLRDSIASSFAAHPANGARRFIVPYQKARGEHKFYFEQWQLDALPDYVEEV
ncbi:MAG: hypothetical protein Rubg2KO_27190 [Rubricoccaceae bacterium]